MEDGSNKDDIEKDDGKSALADSPNDKAFYAMDSVVNSGGFMIHLVKLPRGSKRLEPCSHSPHPSSMFGRLCMLASCKRWRLPVQKYIVVFGDVLIQLGSQER